MSHHTAIGYRHILPVSDPESLITEQVPTPEPGPHDLRVRVEAVSVNPVDVKVRAGAAPTGLRILGFDAAGVVDAVGTDVTLFAPGDHVYYAGAIDRPGTNQRHHLVDERIVGRKPATIDFADAAAIPLTAITSWEALFDRLALTPDSTGSLLVIGATGGVGSVLIQLTRALLPAVTIIATASDSQRADWVRSLGAHQVVDHRGDDLRARLAQIAPYGVDAVFTAHSAGQIELYADIVRPFGAVVAIDDGPRDVEPLKGKSIAWHWEFMFARPLHRTPDLIEQHHLLNRVAELIDAGRVRPTTTRTLSPISASNLREAHRLIETGHTLGKIVLHGWDDD